MPSNKVLEQKQQIVADLAEQLKNSVSGVLVSYQGIKVEDDTKMRKDLREAGVSYTVQKNTLTGRACEMVGLGGMKQYLSGMTAIAISSKDHVAPAKILKAYDEKVESFKILAGYIDGELISADSVKELADIPSMETLIAKFLGSIKSPVYGLAYALQAVADKLAAPATEEVAPAAEA